MPHRSLLAAPGVERSVSVHSALKKPSRTAAEKKVVHFADTLGLDLVQIRAVYPYTSSDEDFGSPSSSFILPPPSMKPQSAAAAKRATAARIFPHSGSFNHARYLHLHTPAISGKDYMQINRQIIQKARTNGLCLRSSNVIGMTFSGVVACFNFDYHKKVNVRYSVDAWRTHSDICASFVNSSASDNVDNFAFSIFLPQCTPIGAKCHFCIRYTCKGQEYWDNNGGANYTLECKSMAEGYGSITIDDLYDKPVFY